MMASLKTKQHPTQDSSIILYHQYHIVNIVVLFHRGTVTDGEFCSLRSRGETRPLHLWQIIHDASDSVGKMSKATLLKMLDFIYGKNDHYGLL